MTEQRTFHRWTARRPKLFEDVRWELGASGAEKKNFNDLSLLLPRVQGLSNEVARTTMEVTLYYDQPIRSTTLFRQLEGGVLKFARESEGQLLMDPTRQRFLTAGFALVSSQEAAPAMNDLFQFFQQEALPIMLRNRPSLANSDQRKLFNDFTKECIRAIPMQDRALAGVGR